MTSDDTMLNFYRSTVSNLENLIRSLDSELPPIVITKRGPRYVQRSDILACHLKAQRLVSLLNASLILLENGYPQEIYILGRAIDKASEDIAFLSIDKPEIFDKQKQFLDEFFMEEVIDPSDPTSTTVRPNLPRKHIRAALNNVKISSGNPYEMNKISKALHSLFSGFVHGSYVFLLELFTPEYLRFPMSGIRGSAYMNICQENLANHIYRAILPCTILASRLQRQDVNQQLISLAETFAKKTGVSGI